MKIFTVSALLAVALALGACSAFREPAVEGAPSAAYIAERIEVIANDLVAKGQAATIEEAREEARRIVNRELEVQREAARENAFEQSFFIKDPNSRAEGGKD
jgi:polyhydroxyalkanoate synthesis regulator phasin